MTPPPAGAPRQAPVLDVDALLDDPATRARVLTAVRRTEREPSLLGASSHLLVAGRRV